jgi:hypothetical protein
LPATSPDGRLMIKDTDSLSAQNMHWRKKRLHWRGPGRMLASSARHAVPGHSGRRKCFGETNEA